MSKSSEEGTAGNTSPQDQGAGNGGQKDGSNIYEDRGRTKKIIRVVTVMAYVFSVSFVAILLSAYYVFLWEPPNPRLQRHPLTGDPQAEYLMDNLPSPKLVKVANVSEDQLIDLEDSNVRQNIFKRIMTSGREAKDFHGKPATLPQRLLTYEDLLELHKDSSSETLTTLPIIFKALGGGSEPEKLTRSKKMDISLGGKKWASFEKEDSKMKTAEGNDSGELTSVETTAESSTSDVTSTGEPGATVYSEIGNYSYPEAIGNTVKNNEAVTMGSDVVATSETSTTVQTPGLVNDLDDNLDVSLREHESRFSEDLANEESSTTESEVQIYPGEIAMNFIDDEK